MGKTELHAIISAQQKGHENEPLYMIGEQLKDIAEREPVSAELLEQDLGRTGMTLADAAKKLKEYADKNCKGAKCFCITPMVAEKILREFYGLPSAKEKEQVTEKKEVNSSLSSDSGYIDLTDFL